MSEQFRLPSLIRVIKYRRCSWSGRVIWTGREERHKESWWGKHWYTPTLKTNKEMGG
jgi:hypothetical protein